MEEDIMKKKLILITILGLFLFTGCGKVAKLENGQDAVIDIDGKKISVDTLYSKMKDRYALSVLLDMIDADILEKEYEDDDDIKETIQTQIDNMVAIYGRGSEINLLQQTAASLGVSTMKELENYLKVQYKRDLAVDDYAKGLITDEELEDYYKETVFGDITARHILIKPDVTSDMTDDEKTAAEEKALQEARDIIEKLNNGEDFAELAKEYSDDAGSAEDGGLLNPFGHGVMIQEFEDAAKALKDNEYSKEPVKTENGYHIILKESQKETPSLKTVKEDLLNELGDKKLEEDPSIEVTAMEELRKKYKVSFEDASLKENYESYLKNAKAVAKESVAD